MRERHFSQYDLEMEKIASFGEQFLALQSIEGSKAVPSASAEKYIITRFTSISVIVGVAKHSLAMTDVAARPI